MKKTIALTTMLMVLAGCACAGVVEMSLEWDSPDYMADSLCNLDTSFVIVAEQCSCQIVEYRNINEPAGQWHLGEVVDGWTPGEYNQVVFPVPAEGFYEGRIWSIMTHQSDRYPMCVSNIVLKEVRSVRSAFGIVNLR